MTVSQINESFIAAMEQIAKNKDYDVQTTLTIECTITATVSADNGTYTVSYLGSKFTAQAVDKTINYVVNDNVYVLVPNGDFTKDKLILGYPTNSVAAADVEVVSELTTGRDILGFPQQQIDLCSWETAETPITFTSNFYKETIPKYQNYYSRFIFSCKTKIDPITTNKTQDGSYGIRLTVPYTTAADEYFEKEFVLGIEGDKGTATVVGDPYNLPAWMKQSVYIDIPKGATIDANNITASSFVYGFDQEEGHEADIHIKQVSFKAVRKFTSSEMSGYYLYIDTSDGRFLKQNEIEQTQLTAVLRSNGADVLMNTVPVYWFLQDPSVRELDDGTYTDGYTSIGGEGWRIINVNESDNSIINTSQVRWDVKLSDVSQSNCYKCVVDYDSTYISRMIYVFDMAGGPVSLNTLNSATTVARDIGVADMICRIDDIDALDLDDDYNSFNSLWYSLNNDIDTAFKNYIAIQSDSSVRDQLSSKRAAIKTAYQNRLSRLTESAGTCKANTENQINVEYYNKALEQIEESNALAYEVIDDTSITRFKTYEILTPADVSGPLIYVWSMYDASGEYINAGIGSFWNPIQFSVKARDMMTSTQFQCAVYRDSALIGRSYYTVSLVDTLGYYVEIINGDDAVVYDKNGYSPNSDNYTGETYAENKFRANKISYAVYRSDGAKINTSEYNKITATWRVPYHDEVLGTVPEGSIKDPKVEYYGSMLNFTHLPGDVQSEPVIVDGDYYTEFSYTGRSETFSYKIDDEYNSRKRNGTIYLIVSFNDITLYDSTSVRFSKEGSNGTEVITESDTSGGILASDDFTGVIVGKYVEDTDDGTKKVQGISSYRGGKQIFDLSAVSGNVVLGSEDEGQIEYTGDGNKIAGIDIATYGLTTGQNGWTLNNNGAAVFHNITLKNGINFGTGILEAHNETVISSIEAVPATIKIKVINTEGIEEEQEITYISSIVPTTKTITVLTAQATPEPEEETSND